MNTVKTKEAIELHFKASKLKNMDGMFGKSDPFLELSMEIKDPVKGVQWEKIGCTEVIIDNLDPVWQTAIIVSYFFGVQQNMRVEVKDMDTENKSESIGIGEFLVSTLITQLSIDVNLYDSGKKKAGTVRIDFEKLQKDVELLTFDFKAEELTNQEWFGKSDPFLRIMRPTSKFAKTKRVSDIPETEWKIVYTSTVIKENLNPDWPPFSISAAKLCNNDFNCPLKIMVWDYSKTGKHLKIAEGFFTLGIIIQNNERLFRTFDSKMKFTGNIILQDFKREIDYTLSDYLGAGLKISTVIAIDFTGSNLEYTNPKSLHHINKGVLNEYQQVIKSVGSILEGYDDDKRIPVYGFGAKHETTGKKGVSHCFPLTKSIFAKEISGVMEFYETTVPKLEFMGPTYFSPIIKGVTGTVKEKFKIDPFSYCVLLIITDGQICDFDETVEQICLASEYPMSILIIGVGDQEFDQMEILDGDKAILQGQSDILDDNGVPKQLKAKRDIVQFVEFNNFKDDVDKLAAEVLAEIPDQVTQFYKSKGIGPNDKR